jgi:hypothetical protein
MKYIITESQYVLLSESLSTEVRRRLPFKNMMNDLEWGILDEMDICGDYDGVGDFIGDACDMLVEMYDVYFINDFDLNISPKDRDSLYYYFVDKFGNYLEKYFKDHKNKCS